jgi:hypothetical protein
MIRDVQITEDSAGFPIVTWTEDRNLASPEAMRRARVECRIMKDKDTGDLLFVARGTVRHGSFEEGRPWERLRAFSTQAADLLYSTKAQLVLREHLASKGVGTKMGLTDGAHVLLAEFFNDTALHINCAGATPVEVDRLHLELTRAFIGKRDDLVGRICSVAFEWPLGDDRVMTCDPERTGWSDKRNSGFLVDALEWAVAVAAVAGLGVFVLWALGAFAR